MDWVEKNRKRFSSLLDNLTWLECSVGWETLIEQMCLDILKYETFLFENVDYRPVRFVQIKDKFGALRVYYDGGMLGNDYVKLITNVIDLYEQHSYTICSFCGSTNAKLSTSRGRAHTVCDNCKNDIDKKDC